MSRSEFSKRRKRKIPKGLVRGVRRGGRLPSPALRVLAYRWCRFQTFVRVYGGGASVGRGLGVGESLGVGVGLGVGVAVGVGVEVGVGVGVGVAVAVAVAVGVAVGVCVAAGVGVGVNVAVAVAVGVDVPPPHIPVIVSWYPTQPALENVSFTTT